MSAAAESIRVEFLRHSGRMYISVADLTRWFRSVDDERLNAIADEIEASAFRSSERMAASK